MNATARDELIEALAELRRVFPEMRLGQLVLNLAEVPYMDSSAIAVLVESLQRLKRAGGRVFLTGLQPRVKGLLEIARLDSIFGIAANEDEALAKP